MLPPVTAISINFVSSDTESKSRRASAELVAVLSLGVTILLAVLGQAAWLDGKIERGDARLASQIQGVDAKLSAQIESTDARLGAQIEGLHEGQAAIRERLAALEAWIGTVEARTGVAGAPASGNEQTPDSKG